MERILHCSTVFASTGTDSNSGRLDRTYTINPSQPGATLATYVSLPGFAVFGLRSIRFQRGTWFPSLAPGVPGSLHRCRTAASCPSG